MKRFWKKALAAALSGALAVSCTLPAFAAGPQSSEMTKNENVFVILNPDGSIREQIVSDWLHSDSGFSAAADRSSLTGITNLTDTVMPEQNGQELTWTTDAKDIYYQGTTDQTPPVTVEIRYTLDGSPVTAEELEGKSGHLVIRLALTNHEGQQKKIGGKTRTVYTPFFTVAALTLPVGTYTDVTALHGTVQTDGSSQIAGFVCLPGVNAISFLPDTLRTLGVRRVWEAFDMDKRNNAQVADAAARLRTELKKAGIPCRTMAWDPACKGIDDFLAMKRSA